MHGKIFILILAVLPCLFLYKSDGLVIDERWYSPGRTDFVLDNQFYTLLERRSNSKLTDLRKAQLTRVSEQGVNKYNVKGDANDAAMIFFSLKPTSVTYKVPSIYRCGRRRCSRRRYRIRSRYRRKYVNRKRRARKMRKWVRKYGGQKVRKYNRKIVRKSRKNGRGKVRRKHRKSGYRRKRRKVRRSRKRSRNGRKKWRKKLRKNRRRKYRSKRKRWGKKSRRSRRRRSRGRWRSGRWSRKYKSKYFEASGKVGVYRVSLKIKPYSTQIVFLSPRTRSLYNGSGGITRIYNFKPARVSWWRLIKLF
ncbi:luc7-like protein 3 [Saccostrea cucullata]|uniref:luc7-like protein 3 n=1 Tax=Saccostrea cuccullata TaxID=36930 RepID=UPI002ED45F29